MWLILEKLPQEGNRVVGQWVAEDDAFEHTYPKKRREQLSAYAKMASAASGYGRPAVGLPPSGGWPDTGSTDQVRIVDELRTTDIVWRDYYLFHLGLVMTKDYVDSIVKSYGEEYEE